MTDLHSYLEGLSMGQVVLFVFFAFLWLVVLLCILHMVISARRARRDNETIARIRAEKPDQWTMAITVQRASAQRQNFIKEHGSLDGCTCNGCPRRFAMANRCVLQYDPYNTNGDCLLSK